MTDTRNSNHYNDGMPLPARPPRDGREDGERCDGSGKITGYKASLDGKGVHLDALTVRNCPGCDNCRNQEAAKCASCDGPATYDPKRYQGGYFCENAKCPAYQWIPKEVTINGHTHGTKQECKKDCPNFPSKVKEEWEKELKEMLVVRGIQENAHGWFVWFVRSLLALTRSRSEKVGEARRTGEILNWLKQALWEEEFSKVEMVVNGHLKSAAKDDGHQVG